MFLLYHLGAIFIELKEVTWHDYANLGIVCHLKADT